MGKENQSNAGPGLWTNSLVNPPTTDRRVYSLSGFRKMTAEDLDEKPKIVAQDILAEKGRPFQMIAQDHVPLNTEFWDGYEAKVTIRVNGKQYEGYDVTSSNIAEAYSMAYCDALSNDFPHLQAARFPTVRQIYQGEKLYTEAAFSSGSLRWVSRLEGLAKSPQDMGKLVAEGLMAGIHLLAQQNYETNKH